MVAQFVQEFFNQFEHFSMSGNLRRQAPLSSYEQSRLYVTVLLDIKRQTKI
jgi:hypothetical protein